MGFETVSAVVLKERLQGDEKCLIVDVRTPGEFQGTHVQDAVNIPLDRLTADQVQAKCNGSERKIYILCQSGGRSRNACQQLSESNLTVINVEGGTSACVAAGLPIVRTKGVIGLERQVRIAAGSLVVLGVVLGLVHPLGFLLSAFIGAGLVFSGVTDTCGMGMVLARMPWNR